MRALKHLLAGLLLAIVVTGCMGDDDERRTAALGEGEAASLSWRGEYTAEAEYQPGAVVTHEGGTFVAVATTGQAPDTRCEVDCAWNVMAETGGAAITQTPAPAGAPSHEHDTLYYRTGYSGPAALPEATQQAVEDWLAGVSRWVIRHEDDGGTVLGQNPFPAGSYLVFARGVYVSAPGLGKETIPQGTGPPLGHLVSGFFSLGTAFKSTLPRLAQAHRTVLSTFLARPVVSEYTVTCALLADETPLDNMSIALSERETGSLSLMGTATVAADTKFSVGCAHNGKKAGPFVRDLYVVAFKYG